MKAKTKCRQVLSLILTLALLLGMLPTTVFAAPGDGGEDENIIKHKAMTLESITETKVSDYQYSSTVNTFFSDININGYEDENGVTHGYSWTLLTYTIEKSQPVDLMLYKLDDDREFENGDTIVLEHSTSASPDEEFLGEFIG